MNYFQKFQGQGVALPPKSSVSDILFAWIGGFIAIAMIGYLTKNYDNLLVMGSFGASCVLLFGYPKSPFSQPRNVIFGHFFSTLIGLSFLHLMEYGIGFSYSNCCNDSYKNCSSTSWFKSFNCIFTWK